MRRFWPWRRAVQAAVVAALFGLPLLANYSHFLAARRLDKAIESWEGTFQGTLLAATDRVSRLGIPDGEGGVPARRPRKAVLRRVQNFNGSVWSATLFGFSLTDLLAGTESAAASRSVRWVLLSGLLVPLVLTALLGRVYCGWICPMGLLSAAAVKTRSLLRLLELRPLSIRLSPWNKYVVLAGGLLAGLVFGMPILHHFYPPALLGREAHSIVAAQFNAAEAGRLGFAPQGLTWASLFLLAIFVLEVAVLPGFWCGSLCPGGALYSLAGRFRLLRVRRAPGACVDCGLCDKACPMGLAPMTDRTGMECDNCGVCVDFCPTGALKVGVAAKDARRARKAVLTGVLAAVLSAPAAAHHIMGIPHYDYDESYPQAPAIRLVETVGRWEVQWTGYPGEPRPGERTEAHAYVVDSKTKELFSGRLEVEVLALRPFGGKVSAYGPIEGRKDNNLWKFYPTFPEEGNYEVVLYLKGEGIDSTLRFTMIVGEPGSPWRTTVVFFGGLGLFSVLIRAVRIKMKRRRAVPA